MRKEWKNYSVDLNNFAAKTMIDKQDFRNKFANVIVKRFDEVLKHQTGKNAIEKMREHGLSGEKEGQSLPDYARTYGEGTRRFQMKSLYDKPTELKTQAYSIEL